ncbi:hypothetical protein FHL15_008204 [Xylaria flabelliformis]|uniref:Ribosomal RNA-processing protein 40 n=1 Tax=Xylaria flabelliformis TaxID=2512241 RepID=A0A553HSR4_9PEZI|nr:hypothetical protein FHL15_008204 [Xylaria flabelliformis]
MAAQTERVIVLPGDEIPASLIPSHPKRALKLGPGLRHVPPSDLIPTVAGQLVADHKKNSIWVEYNGGRRPGPEYYYVSITEYNTNAILPQLAFEMATKKTRPQLTHGALAYARVCLANRHMDPELECVSPTTGKADGLGPLVGGMLYDISLGMARRLLMRKSVEEGKVAVLEELGSAGLAFETAVGRNGKLWVNSDSVKTVLIVGRAVKETDENKLSVEQQKKLVRKLVKEMS